LASTVPTFGLWYDFRQKPPLGDYARFYAECLEEIEESERLGYAGVWLSEHHFVDDGYLPSPLVAAAAIAARTERITVGTNVLLLPMHHPLRVAEDAAVVDLISGGRFTLGVGLGYVWRIGYEGKRWRFDDLPFEPRPGREIPIYLGGYTKPAIDRAVRLADGFLVGGRKPPGEMYGLLREALQRHGRGPDGFPFKISTTVFVNEDPERAWNVVSPGIAYQANRYAEWGTDPGEPKPKRIRPEDLPRERYYVGAPEEVAEKLIGLYEAAPYDHLCFWARLPGVAHEQALESMRLFASEVAPRVRDAVKA
jgi:alkanesulfonate monooxygenase SsuD/methylene tetrahydromethanopterin reductase-like flavin-dependent oxidoreductase (luciferase family)